MKLFHQIGHNYSWNVTSLIEDNAGDGLIFSPVNISCRKIYELDGRIKQRSIFDPQWYSPKESKGKLPTYSFFPGQINDSFETQDFSVLSKTLAEGCIDFQLENDFHGIVIPTRYFEVITNVGFNQNYEYIIEPFLNYYNHLNIRKELILTVIIKKEQVLDQEKQYELLNWITSLSDITGLYLIFENPDTSKQIKDADYLFNVLKILYYLKKNELKIYIGYTNTEALLYSITDPDVLTMGSYENLRRFNIKRFNITEKESIHGPRPRLYSDVIMQWIDYGYIGGIKSLFPSWEEIFIDTKYKPLMFEKEYNWHFTKPEPYKHFYLIFSNQVSNLPVNINDRINYVTESIRHAININSELVDRGIIMDGDSDGSHLYFWQTAINMFQGFLKNEQSI